VPNESFPETLLAELVSGHVDAPTGCLRFVRCPTGKFNTTYFVEGAPEPVALRIAPPDDRSRMLFYEYRMMRQEPEVHARIQAETDIPIPTILAHDCSHERIDRDYLLMRRMPGIPISDHPGLSRSAFDRLLAEVGQALRQVHAICRDDYGYLGEHAPMEPQRDWVSAFAVMWNKLIDDIERCGGYDAGEAAFLRRLLGDRLKVFDRRVSASLLHMDVWAQNILADEHGRLTCLLDWDRALWGDPEIEFAVLDYCGISEPAFWEGYGRRRDESPEAQVRRVFYLLYELQKYIVIRRVRYRSPAKAEPYRRQSLELARTLA
jgi:aminoglycoside phosphotransferase (APT) family kinase protein